MRVPARLRRQQGRHALVDGIPFALPVNSEHTPALMAVFPIEAKAAGRLLPGDELHPVRITPSKGLLVITVVDYRITDIGNYIEFSIAIACTHGSSPAPPLLGGLLGPLYGAGQYVLDLPVSTEISVKGGKGIWGMPKHQAPLEFEIGERKVASRYYLDGSLAVEIEIDRPRFTRLPVAAPAVNYCQFRGMLMKSYIYFRGRAGIRLPFSRSARLTIGDHPRVVPLKSLGIAKRPLIVAYLPETQGTLDDHFEGWFLSYDEPPQTTPEGLESVADLGQGRDWLPVPGKESVR